MSILPKPEAFAREAIILSRMPKVRDYINANTKGCSCGG